MTTTPENGKSEVERFNLICEYGEDGVPEAKMLPMGSIGKWVSATDFDSIQSQLAICRTAGAILEKEWQQTMRDVNELEAENASLASARKQLEEARAALYRIGAWNDLDASNHLRNTGSYSSFGEPGSVEIARVALEKMK